MIGVSADRESLAAPFARLQKESGAGLPAWLESVRSRALDAFAGMGFPTSADEEWRRTSVSPIAGATFRLPSKTGRGGPDQDALRRLSFAPADGPLLAFVNGRFDPGLSRVASLPRGVTLRPLADAVVSEPGMVEPHLARHAAWESHPFVALNTAFIHDGVLLHVAEGSRADEPIHLVFLADDPGGAGTLFMNPRILVVAGKNTHLSLVEIYAGEGPRRYLTNAVTEFVLAERAVVEHCRLVREADDAFHVSTQQALLGGYARLTSHSISLGGLLVRNEANVILSAEGAECTLNGLYMATGRQLIDNHTVIDHARPHCASRELYKGVMDDHSRGVFNGRVIVRPHASKTDSRQANRNLLLSDSALVDTKPELQILNNDVKCSHAATIGQLDETAVFYLRSRGLSQEAARSLLIHAFMSDIISKVQAPSVREGLEGLMLARLPGYQSVKEAAL